MQLSKMLLNSFTSILSPLMLGAGLDPRRKRNVSVLSEAINRAVGIFHEQTGLSVSDFDVRVAVTQQVGSADKEYRVVWVNTTVC